MVPVAGGIRGAGMRKLIFIVSAATGLGAAAADACEFGARPLAASAPLVRPASGDITSGFGMRFHPLLNTQKMHEGVDFAGAPGDPILAARGGRVVESSRKGYYGNYVRIDHGDGLATA